MNSLVVSGRLTANPELKKVKVGEEERTVVEFRIAEIGPDNHDTMFIDIEAWGPLAETVGAHKEKGDAVIVSGNLRYQQFTRKDGTKGSKHSMVARLVEFGAKPHGDQAASEPASEPATGNQPSDEKALAPA